MCLQTLNPNKPNTKTLISLHSYRDVDTNECFVNCWPFIRSTLNVTNTTIMNMKHLCYSNDKVAL